jgi:tRNA/rRNA methyltransferase
LARVRIVLVRPRYGGNIGSACRAMANMGLSDLALVEPGPFNRDEAARLACWAHAILDGRRETATLAEAVADCGRVWGTTARGGLYRRHVRSPRDWAPVILDVARANRVALVFGPEDDGLSNDDLELCNNLIRIPSSETYPALNLAQAVMVCAYELFTAAGLFTPEPERTPEAPADLRERMFDAWRQALLDIGFMDRERDQHMMLGIRRIFARAPLTRDDVAILMGMARQTQWCASDRRRLLRLAGEAQAGPPEKTGAEP